MIVLLICSLTLSFVPLTSCLDATASQDKGELTRDALEKRGLFFERNTPQRPTRAEFPSPAKLYAQEVTSHRKANNKGHPQNSEQAADPKFGGLLEQIDGNEVLGEVPEGFPLGRDKREHYRKIPYVSWLVNHLLTLRRNMEPPPYGFSQLGSGSSFGPKRSKFSPPKGFSFARGK